MDALKNSFSALRSAYSSAKRVKNRKAVVGLLDQTESLLEVLQNKSPSPKRSDELVHELRGPLASTLYPAFPQAALHFAATATNFLFFDKICSEVERENAEQRLRWDSALNALLSGVLDYHDQYESPECKEAIATNFYKVLCAIGFSDTISLMTVTLQCTVYSALSDTASGSKLNQDALRSTGCVGSAKLGSRFWLTRDYLVLEALLTLFARMLPVTNNTASGRASRSAFIRGVFISSAENPKAEKAGEEIASLLEHLTSKSWEPTGAKIFDILANLDISYPQPLKVTKIALGDETKSLDSMFADHTGFCANVVTEDDQYEALEISYSSIEKLEVYRVAAMGSSSLKVKAHVNTLPLIGGKPAVDVSVQGYNQAICVQFELAQSEFSRFCTAMRSRGLGKRLVILHAHKLSLSHTPAILEVDSAGKLVGKEERYQTVSKVYGTNDPDLSDSVNGDEDAPSMTAAQPPLTPPTSILVPSNQFGADVLPATMVAASEVSVMSAEHREAAPIDAPNAAEDSDNDEVVRGRKSQPDDSPIRMSTRSNRRRNQVISDDEIEDTVPASTLAVSRRRSVLNLAPGGQGNNLSKTRYMAKGKPKTTSASALPQDLSAGASATAHRLATKNSKVTTPISKTARTLDTAFTISPLTEQESPAIATDRLDAPKTSEKKTAAAKKANAREKTITAKKEQVKEKTDPAKKDNGRNDNAKKERNVKADKKAVKRKVADTVEDSEPTDVLAGAEVRPAKRQRQHDIQSESDGLRSTVLSSSNGPPKRYHANRGRKPVPLAPPRSKPVDYDEIPGSDSLVSGARASSPLDRKSALSSRATNASAKKDGEEAPKSNRKVSGVAEADRNIIAKPAAKSKVPNGKSKKPDNAETAKTAALCAASPPPKSLKSNRSPWLKGKNDNEKQPKKSPVPREPSDTLSDAAGDAPSMDFIVEEPNPEPVSAPSTPLSVHPQVDVPAEDHPIAEEELVTSSVSKFSAGEQQQANDVHLNRKRSQPPSIEDFAQILNKINEVIVENMANKIGRCHTEIDAGKDRLLEAAAADLEEMGSASIERFNALIALESEYASFARNMNHSLEDLVKANSKSCDALKKAIQLHNSKANAKMPKTLFKGDLPPSIAHFRA
ncbi:hypothetical protein EIP91_007133 [Steccherinum ochraceum]|uniref:Uncharacterized protein n=1 Tax=Steccherinum ochraceum TaxID=92696 RepID=A0A4R0R738_9APHY|nr:hypothetical protein EIP91_007133 [Steccherinum ochraceum]